MLMTTKERELIGKAWDCLDGASKEPSADGKQPFIERAKSALVLIATIQRKEGVRVVCAMENTEESYDGLGVDLPARSGQERSGNREQA